ncbi:hypothetical protein [Chthonobacter rhizosphaerae]|uniref:hypothetical protein n=1 Tax=Chthonobacter rhizosphaerae TaxID=2735553 RepID=UPI0015EEE587|nr:hypothetical protein [Chthonobacter rhizosphaerae]
MADPLRNSTPPTHDASPEKNPTEARGAAPANRVRWVLVIGIALVIVAFFLAYIGTRP